MNSMHTVAGVFNGGLTGIGVCKLTIAGTGPLFMNGTAPQGFSTTSPGTTTITTPISGAAILTLEGSGQMFLNANNIYTGGMMFGYANGPAFTGVLNFPGSSAFGTGNIIVSNTGTSICGFVYTGSSAVSITNKWTWSSTNAGVNVVGIPAGVTFSGTVAFGVQSTNVNLFTGGGNTNLIIMSGVISGGKVGGNFNKGNQSTLRLSGANSHVLTTTVSNGVLQAGVNGCIPSGAGKGDLIVAKNVNAVDIGIFDVNGFSVTCNGLFGDGVIDNTAAGASTITFGANNVTGNFSGTFQNTGGPLNLTKTGTGTETINAGTYTGNTTVNGGTLSSQRWRQRCAARCFTGQHRQWSGARYSIPAADNDEPGRARNDREQRRHADGGEQLDHK